MRTQAQMDAELTTLRKLMADRPERPAAHDAPPEEVEPAMAVDLRAVLDKLETLPQKNPMTLAVIALAVGYLIGRSR